MKRFEKLSSIIYDLIEDVSHDKVTVHNKTVALNSLHLLRDSLIDLRYAYSLAKELREERLDLMKQQVEQKKFSGELHEQYHETSGQLRAVSITILQLGKRVLNSSSYVLASFVPHGVAIKNGSFGKQYESAKKLDISKLDTRSKALIKNLLANGAKLEIYNDTRDNYIEHVKPATIAQQQRPMHTGTGVNYTKEKPEFAGIQERLLSGMVREAMPGYILIGEKDSQGNEVRTYHVHVKHSLAPLRERILRSVYTLSSPDDDPDHFKKLEPHSHAFTIDDSDDEVATDYSMEITKLASVDALIKDYCGYIKRMLSVIR